MNGQALGPISMMVLFLFNCVLAPNWPTECGANYWTWDGVEPVEKEAELPLSLQRCSDGFTCDSEKSH